MKEDLPYTRNPHLADPLRCFTISGGVRIALRLRAAMWRQWKTLRRRRAALLELGVREPLASNTAGSGRGPWYLAKAQGPGRGAFECILQIAGTSVIVRGLLA
jgi:hypothetical protein